MKVHVGAASKTGLIHSASATAANVHEHHQVPDLLHGQESRLYGDSAYRGREQPERWKIIASNAKDFTNKRAYKNRWLIGADKATNRQKSNVSGIRDAENGNTTATSVNSTCRVAPAGSTVRCLAHAGCSPELRNLFSPSLITNERAI